jgi:hypothetical protein
MTTLHIQVPVADVTAFKAGFADHTELRRKAGVRSERVQRCVDDQSFLVVDLDFGTTQEAQAFLGYLRDTVWVENAQVLAGTPAARILEPLALS